jgi:hypothetical protein
VLAASASEYCFSTVRPRADIHQCGRRGVDHEGLERLAGLAFCRHLLAEQSA